MKEKIYQAITVGLFIMLAVIVQPKEASTAPPLAQNADTVDGFHASALPQVNTLLALDANAKLPNSVLYTGSGSGLDADLLDGLQAAAFVQQGQTNSVITNMLVSSAVTTPKLADTSVTGVKIQNITRIITANLMGWNSETLMSPGLGVRTLSNGNTQVMYTFAVPYDYAGGDLAVREWYRIHDAYGTAKIFRWMSKLTPGGQDIGIETATPFDFSSSGLATSRNWTISASVFNPGDMFWVLLERRGDLVDDTMGRLDLRAVAVEYTAEQ